MRISRRNSHDEQTAGGFSRQPETQFEIEARVVDGSCKANARQSVDDKVYFGPLNRERKLGFARDVNDANST
jgi:hypothetical protein